MLTGISCRFYQEAKLPPDLLVQWLVKADCCGIYAGIGEYRLARFQIYEPYSYRA